VNIFVGFVVVVVIVAVSVTAMLVVRRRAPEGSYFTDGDRASGVFGVLATGFSVLLGFIVFLAFSNYDNIRSGAEAESVVVVQQVQAAQFFPEDIAEEMTGQLVCYGRSVIGVEWERLQDGTLGDETNPWGASLLVSLEDFEPEAASEQSAYDHFLDLTIERQNARNDRVHSVAGVIPTPLWLVLFLVSGVIFLYLLFFADPAEGAATQGLLMGSVTTVITVLLLLLVFFNRPFQDDVGGLQPDSMERSLAIIDDVADEPGIVVGAAPCDENGQPIDG
jgi:Protein of unknown function (DUF4239)